MFRVLAGFGGCAPLALGATVIGDMYAPEERGSAMALYVGLQLGGPAVGVVHVMNTAKVRIRMNLILSI
jgi:MFS family permease